MNLLKPLNRSRKTRKTKNTRKTRKPRKTRKRKNPRKNAKNYKHLIVGGGISGLYLYYNLLKTKKVKAIDTCLMEKSYELGGRVQTINIDTPDNNKHVFEVGAGRINGKHKHLMDLIKEFGLNKKIIKISGETTFITKNKSLKSFRKTPYDYFQKLYRLSKKYVGGRSTSYDFP